MAVVVAPWRDDARMRTDGRAICLATRHDFFTRSVPFFRSVAEGSLEAPGVRLSGSSGSVTRSSRSGSVYVGCGCFDLPR